MRFLIAGFLSSIFFISTQAQEVSWSSEYKKVRRQSNISQVLGQIDQSIYAVMTTQITADQIGLESTNSARNRGNTRSSLVRFDQSLALQKEVPFELRIDKRRVEFEFAEKVGSQLYMFVSNLDRKKNRNVLLAQPMDLKSLQPVGEPFEVAHTNMRGPHNIGSFARIKSRKKNYFLLVGYEPYKRNEEERFNLTVFDREMQEQWSKSIKVPYRDDLFHIQRFLVDDRGDVYVLGKKYFGKVRDRSRGKPNYSYVILAYRYKGREFEEYEIKLKDKFITDLTFTVSDAGDLVCAGFYSDRGTMSVKGTYFMSIDAISSQIKQEGFKNFEPNFLAQFMNSRQAAKGRELYEYRLEEIVLRADGGALLLAEQYYVRAVNTYEPDGTTRTRFYYNYNDIIVVNINPDMSIEWATKVPKRQETVDDGGYFSSFVHAITNERIYLVYNDNARNIGRDPNRTPLSFNGSRSVVMLASIDMEGNFDREIISSNRDEGIITRPKSCEQVKLDKLVIYGSRGRLYKMGAVAFN